MSSIPSDPITESVLLLVQRVVNGQNFHSIRQAVMGEEAEMLDLLASIPGLDSEPNADLKIRAWIGMLKFEVALQQWRDGYGLQTSDLDAFVMQLINLISEVPEGGVESDFFPSRLLLSASQRVLESREQVTPYNQVSRTDTATIWNHPWMTTDTSTARWFRSGRATPVPLLLRPQARLVTPAAPAATQVNLSIPPRASASSQQPQIHHPKPVRPAVEKSRPLSGVPSSLPPGPKVPSKRTREAPSRSRSRGRTPSARLVTMEDDSAVGSSSPTPPPARKRRSSRPTTKKSTATSTSEAPKSMKIRIPPTPKPEVHNEALPPVNRGKCDHCMKRQLACVPSAATACCECQRSKVKCSFAPRNWKESELNHPQTHRKRSPTPAPPRQAKKPGPQARSRSRSRPPTVQGNVAHTESPTVVVLNHNPPESFTPSPHVETDPVKPNPPVPSTQPEMQWVLDRLERSEEDRVLLLRRVDELEVEMSQLRGTMRELLAMAEGHSALLDSHRQHLGSMLTSTILPNLMTPQPEIMMPTDVVRTTSSTPGSNSLSPAPLPMPPQPRDRSVFPPHTQVAGPINSFDLNPHAFGSWTPGQDSSQSNQSGQGSMGEGGILSTSGEYAWIPSSHPPPTAVAPQVLMIDPTLDARLRAKQSMYT